MALCTHFCTIAPTRSGRFWRHFAGSEGHFDPRTDATIRNYDRIDETKHHRRTTTLLPEEMTVIVPSFDSERKVGGGFLPSLTNKVDAWLRKQSIDRKTMSRVLSQPLPHEVDGDAKRNPLDAW